MIYENDKLKIVFEAYSGGFPTQIFLQDEAQYTEVLKPRDAFFSLELSDGRKARPFLDENTDIIEFRHPEEECQWIQFNMIKFKDQYNKIVDDFYLSMRYDVYDDGHVFVKSYFTIDNGVKFPDIKICRFEVGLDFTDFQQIYQPCGMSANLENIFEAETGKSMTFDEIKPTFNFTCKRQDGRGAYIEFFMEDNTDLIGGKNVQSAIRWDDDDNPTISWDFQTEEIKDLRYPPPQWRQQWGWLFTTPPKSRRLPPMRMYQLFDDYEDRVAPVSLIKKIKNQGADIVVLHENWRLDVRGSEFPYAPQTLREFIKAAHEHDIRVVLYCRGMNELGTTQDFCAWRKLWLEKNYDGLYFDYGGVLNGLPYRFKQHYLKLRKIRREIGRYGLIYCHLGTLNSAVGLTPDLVDGYTAGEGESGKLSESRFMHESLSGSYVTTGTMWTAAFPHYSNGCMIPYMVSSGQYAHILLGNPVKSSALSCSRDPGVDDIYLRPLWQLRGIFARERDMKIYNEYNSTGIFNNSDTCGSYLMITHDNSMMMMLLTNFAEDRKEVSCRINWSKLGIKPDSYAKSYILKPTSKGPGKAVECESVEDFSMELDGYGCAGVVFGRDERLGKILKDYCRPYPEDSEALQQHRQKVKEQKDLRLASKDAEAQLFVKLNVSEPPSTLSCANAFFNVNHEIGFLDENTNFVSCGYITLKGFQKNEPGENEVLWAGYSSPWVNLHDVIPQGGAKTIVIKTFRRKQKAYFHSCITVDVSTCPGVCDDTYSLEFMNEVESAPERLHFNINLQQS